MKQIQNNDCTSAIELCELLATAYMEGTGVKDRSKAYETADKMLTVVRQMAGCGEIYIPAPSRKLRDQSIVREYNGRNVPELAKKHGLSERHIHRVVAKASL